MILKNITICSKTSKSSNQSRVIAVLPVSTMCFHGERIPDLAGNCGYDHSYTTETPSPLSKSHHQTFLQRDTKTELINWVHISISVKVWKPTREKKKSTIHMRAITHKPQLSKCAHPSKMVQILSSCLLDHFFEWLS